MRKLLIGIASVSALVIVGDIAIVTHSRYSLWDFSLIAGVSLVLIGLGFALLLEDSEVELTDAKGRFASEVGPAPGPGYTHVVESGETLPPFRTQPAPVLRDWMILADLILAIGVLLIVWTLLEPYL